MHLNNLFNESIVKKGSKYVVKAESGREMGTYDSKEKANKRLRQIEMFKHMAESINLTEAEADIKVEVPGVGVYTADTLSSNIIQSIEKLHQAAQEGDWEQVEYSLDPGKMGATLLVKSKALVQALKQNRLLEAEAIDPDMARRAKASSDAARERIAKINTQKRTVAKDPAVVRARKVSTTGARSPGDEVSKAKAAADDAIAKAQGKLNTGKSGTSTTGKSGTSTTGKAAKALGKGALKAADIGLKGLGLAWGGQKAFDAYKAYKKGDYGDAALHALSAPGYAYWGKGAWPATALSFMIDPSLRDFRQKMGQSQIDTKELQKQQQKGLPWAGADPDKVMEEFGNNILFKNLIEYTNKLDDIEVDVLGEAGKDACYHKVKSRYKVWPSAYASGALVQCRKKGAKNWGNKSKKKSNENVEMDSKLDVNKLLTSLKNSGATNSDRLVDAIEMRFMHNMTFKEIGEELNVGPERARMIVAKALRLMRWHAARNPN